MIYVSESGMGRSPVRVQSKTRKPYTITKQREKWTDEEHCKFLEALRLHGRAWQRIQEHIGTKSAVQIRSHAQKFFLKLEKGNGGKSPGHSHDIEIPPPRPKRRPYISYPRQTGAASRSSSEEVREKNLSKLFLLSPKNVALDAKIKTFGKDPPSTSIYFHNDDISEHSQEHIPMLCELKEKRNQLSTELKKNDAELQISETNENLTDSHFVFTQSKDNLEDGQSHETLGIQFEGIKYSGEGISTSFSALKEKADLNLSLDSTRSAAHRPKNSAAISSIHQSVPSISLVNHLQNDDNAFDALISLTNHFPSLLASALLQNPAIYHAASVAAAILPTTLVEFSMHSNTKLAGEAPKKQSSASPGMPAIVTATIAAASAWWRVHGLLPSPFLANHTLLQTTEVSQVHEDDGSNSKDNINQNLKKKSAMQTCSALLKLSSSPDTCLNQVQGKKKHDPSSCDSNTSPGCEVEKDAALNKEKVLRISEGELAPSPSQEFRDAYCSKRLEQGSLALQWPQGFSPLHLDDYAAFNPGKEEAFRLQIDLNRKAFTATTCNVSNEIALNDSGIATYKGHLVDAEKYNTDQEESSAKRTCL
ncbi:Protein LHY [Platanthera guangdongensis]|uniref:Protein LHY n=1 Tax=Platanthera guangdongensis TaxID=2320717 RepID=A0ABR2LP85_9ASPA